jgi:hypothetical protein
MVIEQMTLTAVSSTARTLVTASNKRFCMIERQLLKYGEGIGGMSVAPSNTIGYLLI